MRNLQKQSTVNNPFTKIAATEESPKKAIEQPVGAANAIAELTAKLKAEASKIEETPSASTAISSTATLGGKADVDEDPAKAELKLPGTDTKSVKDPSEKVYTKEEIMPLMDALLLNGYAVNSFNLGKSTPVALKTRFAWEERLAVKYAEKSPLTSNIGYQRELTLGLVAASLVQFGNIVFDPHNDGKEEVLEASFLERLTFANGLSNVFFDIIVHKMYDFDSKQKYLIDHFDELMENF